MSELLDDIWLSTFLLFRKSTELNYIVPWYITGILRMCGTIRIKIKFVLTLALLRMWNVKAKIMAIKIKGPEAT